MGSRGGLASDGDGGFLPWVMLRGVLGRSRAAHASRLLLSAGPRLRAQVRAPHSPPIRPRRADDRHAHCFGDILSFVSILIVVHYLSTM